MHVSLDPMRTTLEITDVQRARLLEIAAARGEKGFSSVVREAIDRFLEANAHRAEKIEKALALAGTLGKRAADELEKDAEATRRHWR
jgi:hypothetical protein